MPLFRRHLQRAIAAALIIAFSSIRLSSIPAAAQEAAKVDPIDLRADWTQYLSGPVTGEGDNALRYGGRMDAYAQVDGEGVGLWKGLTINAQAEFVYGDNVNRIGSRVFLPVNSAMSLPVNGDEGFDFSINIVQRFGKLRIQAGKINLFDAAVGIPIASGGGKEGFQHMGLAAPPGLLTSPKVLGAIASAPVGPLVFNVGVWSPQDWTRAYFSRSPVKEGVNGMFAAVLPTRIGGLQGYHTATLYVTSRQVTGSEDYPDIKPPPGIGMLLPRDAGGTHIRYAIQQFLWQDPSNPKRGWGLFGHVGVSTGAPGILDWSVTGGFAGAVPLASRPNDRFGIGYFRYSLADKVVKGLAPVIPLGDEQGGEIYYTAQIAKPLRLTASGQLIDPGFANAPTAAYVNLRLKAAF